MFQLLIIVAILYIILLALTKLEIYKGLEKVLTIVNRIFIVLAIIIVVIKTGLIRLIATFISVLLIQISEFISTIF